MSWFRSSASSAILDVAARIGIHSFPVVTSGEQFKRLSSTRVAYRRVIVMLLEDSYP
jgi:hypothetical protein